ncbi:MAG: N-formylglutamate amidohydrolase [Planctomycetes bacterium]|nr:N-formylglutamate amidohydrolase [Planctomycetota bacterium]
MRQVATKVVVTCEHASFRVPRELDRLGLPAAVLRSHRGWDPGALPVARAVAAAFSAPLFAGEWSRLLVDLNRSADQPAVIVPTIDGRPVPGNALTATERRERLDRYWAPWRAQVEQGFATAKRRRQPVLHLSIHSFVERLHGVERTNDVGLLYDHRRPRERALARALRDLLRGRGCAVRCNFPYYGHTDGHTSWWRRRLSDQRYLGIEIELNQRTVRTARKRRELQTVLIDALELLIAGDPFAR